MINVELVRESILRGLSSKQIELVENHLRKRFESRKSKPGLTVVYDILYDCNLQCRGCSVSPSFRNTLAPIPPEKLRPRTDDIFTVLGKIKSYTDKQNKSCFVNYGGGEPFLRSDLEEIIQVTAKYFGPSGVGIDTNGIVEGELERVTQLEPYFSYLGVSLDGLEDYHNWWRGGTVKGGPFARTVELLKGAVAHKKLASKLEVSSVATKNNIDQIPKLMEYLRGLGITNYSVHRAMAVGRMEQMSSIVPDSKEYFHLLVAVLETANQIGMHVHLHHSIESIYATILLGYKTYHDDRVGNPDGGSSLGIEPGGTLVFDPWSMRGVWMKLSGGNFLDPSFDLSTILQSKNQSLLQLSKSYTHPTIRCHGCPLPCSGGNRIAAAARSLISKHHRLLETTVTEAHLLDAMVEIDPACPLYSGL